MSATQTDVVVVGAGPAGAATAILLAEHGLDVVVLDRGSLPRPKICGEYLSPEAGRVLDRLGVLKAVDAAGAAAIHGMRITAPDGTAITGHYRDIGDWRPYRHHAMGVPAPRWTARWSSACAHCRWTSGSTPVSSICCSTKAWSGVSGSLTATRGSTICARGSSWAPTAARRWWPNGWGAGGPTRYAAWRWSLT